MQFLAHAWAAAAAIPVHAWTAAVFIHAHWLPIVACGLAFILLVFTPAGPFLAKRLFRGGKWLVTTPKGHTTLAAAAIVAGTALAAHLTFEFGRSVGKAQILASIAQAQAKIVAERSAAVTAINRIDSAQAAADAGADRRNWLTARGISSLIPNPDAPGLPREAVRSIRAIR